MPRFLILLLAALLLAGASPAFAQGAETGFLDRAVKLEGREYRYVLYVPRGFRAEQRWPVILFLHGAGERGDDGLKQSQVGLPGAVRLHPERFPALMVMPQCPTGERWEGAPAAAAMAALDETITAYNGDPERIYLTGLSMGGAGSWRLALDHPGRFAAVAPLCGGGPIEEIAAKLKDLPVWVFVGDQDRPQTVDFCRQVSRALKEAGSTKSRYTEYPGIPHNCWDLAYSEPEFAAWLFAQRRTAPAAGAGR
jgi:predicted peptidase